MPRILSVATAVPPHEVSQAEIKNFALEALGSDNRIERMFPVFENARVEKRYFVRPVEWYLRPHDFTEMNDAYIESALNLSEEVVFKACRPSRSGPIRVRHRFLHFHHRYFDAEYRCPSL